MLNNMKYEFSQSELESKGFTVCTDGDFTYMLYLCDPDNYWDSKFLTTETDTLLSIDWVMDTKEKLKYRVVSPKTVDGIENFMTEQEIDKFIQTGIYE